MLVADKMLVNLATGLEAPSASRSRSWSPARLQQGKSVAIFLTKDAVRLALPGTPRERRVTGARPWPGCSRSTSSRRRAAGVPDLFHSRRLDEASMVANATIAGATPMLEWIGSEPALVFSTSARAAKVAQGGSHVRRGRVRFRACWDHCFRDHRSRRSRRSARSPPTRARSTLLARLENHWRLTDEAMRPST